MSAHGVVSIVDEEGRTLVKAHAASDGENASKLAHRISLQKIRTLDGVYAAALELNFGRRSVVVLDGTSQHFRGFDSLPPEFRERFSDPKFDPRSADGRAANVFVVRLPSFNVQDYSAP